MHESSMMQESDELAWPAAISVCSRRHCEHRLKSVLYGTGLLVSSAGSDVTKM